MTMPQGTLIFMQLANSRSGTLPASGFYLTLICMIAMSVLLCFSKFWRLRRAERVRKQKRDEEEEEDFLRMMGIDPANLDESDDEEANKVEDESDSSSDEDDDDDEVQN